MEHINLKAMPMTSTNLKSKRGDKIDKIILEKIILEWGLIPIPSLVCYLSKMTTTPRVEGKEKYIC